MAKTDSIVADSPAPEQPKSNPPCRMCGTRDTELTNGWWGIADWFCFACDLHFDIPVLA